MYLKLTPKKLFSLESNISLKVFPRFHTFCSHTKTNKSTQTNSKEQDIWCIR